MLDKDEVQFLKWGKTPRLLDIKVTISEKLDGTNGLIYINNEQDGILAGSRNRWLGTSKSEDNAGFCKWVLENKAELIALLGPGYHYGEWWGQGVQRTYGMKEKVFSLFNVGRWGALSRSEPRSLICDVVPSITLGHVTRLDDVHTVAETAFMGDSVSAARYGVEFSNPEGYMIYLHSSKQTYKVPINK